MEEPNAEPPIPPPWYSASAEDNSKESSSTAPLFTGIDSPEDKSKPTPKQVLVTGGDNPQSMVLRELGDIATENDDLDFEDETIVERLIGLTEMFPESVRNAATRSFSVGFKGLKSAYSLSRSLTWFIASTATLCFLPLILELERVQTEEQEAAHQRTMMLGPRAAGGGSTLAGFSAAVPHLTPMDSR